MAIGTGAKTHLHLYGGSGQTYSFTAKAERATVRNINVGKIVQRSLEKIKHITKVIIR